MKVIVFGPNSMVARSLIPRLRDHEILTVGRHNADLLFDLESDVPIAVTSQYDTAIICTASFGGDDPEGLLLNVKVNALGALRVAHLAVQAGCRHVILLSSLSSIDHPDNGYFGSYGLSKRQGEEDVALLCRLSGVGCTILRATQLYDVAGLGRRHQPLLYHIVDRARAGEEVVLFGRRDPLRNYLFCDDFAEMIERALIRGVTGIHPCVAPVSLPLSEIAVLAFRTFGMPQRVRFLPERPDIPTVHIPDGRELYTLLDYQPKIDLEQGLRMMQERLSA